MNEFEIIAEIFAPLATAPGAFGLKDDAAIIAARPGFDLVVTTDQIEARIDFMADDPPALVAQKALRVNLSDLAAKGAVPEFYLLTLALPGSVAADWLKAFAAGLAEDQKNFGLSLLGGDTGHTQGSLAISITAFGFVPAGGMLRRSGAKLGDGVYVTGSIGDSGLGLAVLKNEIKNLSEAERGRLIAAYRLPQPPVSFGPRLRGLANASADISDGLVADLGHVARASGVGIVIDGAAIPRPPAILPLLEGKMAILRAATAGDDYQIAFTADPGRESEIVAAAKEAGVPVTRIGRVEAGEGVALMLDGETIDVPQPGYRHFS